MHTQIVRRVLSLVVLMLALSAHALADGRDRGEGSRVKLSGLINDYTADLDGGGPWHIVGEWQASIKGRRNEGSFFAALSMVRADNPARASHTHHVWIDEGVVTALPNGYRISGNAAATGNGSAAGFSGSPVEVVVTGGNATRFSNVAITFGGGAAGHFGAESVDGVVTEHR
jgi:hypothetical protein